MIPKNITEEELDKAEIFMAGTNVRIEEELIAMKAMAQAICEVLLTKEQVEKIREIATDKINDFKDERAKKYQQ